MDSLRFWFISHELEKFHSKLLVETFIPRDEFIREAETRHETSLLQPVDRTERTTEEDTLNTRKCKEALSKRARLVKPFHSPLRLLLNARHCLNGFKELLLLSTILNVFVNQLGIGLTVYHLVMALIGIERTRFAYLHLICKIVIDILKNNSIGSSKECQDILYKLLFIIIECFPVVHILRKIHFLCSPVGHLSLLVEFPKFWILQGKDRESV